MEEEKKEAKLLLCQRNRTTLAMQPLIRVQGFSGDGGPAVIPSATHECSAERTNKLNLSPPPPPPLYTHNQKSPTRGQRTQTKKARAICPV